MNNKQINKPNLLKTNKQSSQEIKNNSSYLCELDIDSIEYICGFLDLMDIGFLSRISKQFFSLIKELLRNMTILKCSIGDCENTDKTNILRYSRERTEWFNNSKNKICDDIVYSDMERIEALVIAFDNGFELSPNAKIYFHCMNGMYCLTFGMINLYEKLLKKIGKYVDTLYVTKILLNSNAKFQIIDKIKKYVKNIVTLKLLLIYDYYKTYQKVRKNKWDEEDENNSDDKPHINVESSIINYFEHIVSIEHIVLPFGGTKFHVQTQYPEKKQMKTIKSMSLGGVRYFRPSFDWSFFWPNLEHLSFDVVIFREKTFIVPRLKTLHINIMYAIKIDLDELIAFLHTIAEKVIINETIYCNEYPLWISK